MKPKFNDNSRSREVNKQLDNQQRSQGPDLTRRTFTGTSKLPPKEIVKENMKQEIGESIYHSLTDWLRTQGKVIESAPQQDITYTIPEVNEARDITNKIIREYNILKKNTQSFSVGKENMKNRLNKLEKMQNSIETYLRKATKLFGDLSMRQNNEASNDPYITELEQNIEITRRNYKLVKKESNQIFKRRPDIALIYKDNKSLAGRAARESIGSETLKEWYTAQNNIERDKKSQNYQLLSSEDQHFYKTTYQELLETGDKFHEEYINWLEKQNTDNGGNIHIPDKITRALNEAINNLSGNIRDLQTLGDGLESSMNKAQEINESVCKLADALIEIDMTKETLKDYDRRNNTDLWSKFNRRRINEHERDLIYTYLATKGLEETTLSKIRRAINLRTGTLERSTRLLSSSQNKSQDQRLTRRPQSLDMRKNIVTASDRSKPIQLSSTITTDSIINNTVKDSSEATFSSQIAPNNTGESIELNQSISQEKAIDITKRLKQLQDLPSYQSDLKISPSSDHMRNTRKKAIEDIIKKGQDLGKLMNSHKGRPLPEHLIKHIHELLDQVPHQYDAASRYLNEDGTEILPDKREKALRNLQETAYLLSFQKESLERECVQQIGGNTDLRNQQKLKLVGWGEQHDNRVHYKRCAELIEDLARNSRVIVLVEGVNAGTLVKTENNEVTRKLSQDVRKNVTVYGWDNLDLIKKVEEIQEAEYGAIRAGIPLEETLKISAECEDIKMNQRNKVLLDSLNEVIQQHDDINTKFVVIAGLFHFEDKILQQNLEKYSYAILNSAYKDETFPLPLEIVSSQEKQRSKR